METTIITAISNTSSEYRDFAAKLTEILEYYLSYSRIEEYRDEMLNDCIEKLSQQIQELRAVANALEDITANYGRLQKTINSAVFDIETRTADTEFGISEFGNLSEHEKLMPIHG